MRGFTVGCALFVFVLGGVAAAQAPKPAAAKAAASRPDGDLLQIMRGIVFPNANIIFDAQTRNPGAPLPSHTRTETSTATETFGNLYGGWQGVENAAVALIESADLVMKPGRVCGNGVPVPVGRADWIKFSEGLRTAGRSALKAARAKDQDKMVDIAGEITEMCAACHGPYRDKPQRRDLGPVLEKNRCT